MDTTCSSGPSRAPRSPVRTALVIAAVTVVGVLALGAALVGVAGYLWAHSEEGQCHDGERPVYSTEYATGGQCVADGEQPPAGFADYPEGRVPQYVGDQYDRWPLAADYPWADEVDPALRAAAGQP